MIKVESITLQRKPCVTSTSPHIFESGLEAYVEVVKHDVKCLLTFRIAPGFKCDGASVPWLFRWFLPSWAKDNGEKCITEADIYNVGSCIHDGLYIHRGFGIFDRDECDDILRGIWRESGIGRFKAGVADVAIGAFAGGKKHWGNDSLGVGNLFEMEW